MANQLCSLVNIFNDVMYSLWCHITTGAVFNDQVLSDPRCTLVQGDAIWLLAFLPYFWRMMQCFRKHRDNPPANWRQLHNAGKYFSSKMTTLFTLLYKNVPSVHNFQSAHTRIALAAMPLAVGVHDDVHVLMG
jgi:hypothetical protein